MDEDRPWRSLREKVFWISLALTLGSIAGLLVLYRYEPSSIPAVRATEKGKLDPGVFGAMQTFLTTSLSIGAIALLFDLLLRETYGRTLRRFLNLKTALVRSGLCDVATSAEVPWQGVVESASEITGLVRDPSQWLVPHLTHMLRAAQRRSTAILIGLPDPEGANLEAIAVTVGLTEEGLQQNIAVAVEAVRNQWTANRTHLHAGSTIRVVTYDELPLYELLIADEQIVCLVSSAIGHTTGMYQLAMTFDQPRDQYPAGFLREATNSLANRNELWAGTV